MNYKMVGKTRIFHIEKYKYCKVKMHISIQLKSEIHPVRIFPMIFNIQWCVTENYEDPVYVVNSHFSTCPNRCQKCYYAVFKLCIYRYGLGLSNELLFIIIAQEAAKL